jgi:rhodanese-related sulfurtransferase
MKTVETDAGPVGVLTPQEVYEGLEAGELALIDVRTPQEYMVEHVHGAMLMPMAFFRPATLPGGKAKKVVIHCGSGARSLRMAQKALSEGVAEIAHMDGGMAGWKQAGLPYIGTDLATGAPKRMG